MFNSWLCTATHCNSNPDLKQCSHGIASYPAVSLTLLFVFAFCNFLQNSHRSRVRERERERSKSPDICLIPRSKEAIYRYPLIFHGQLISKHLIVEFLHFPFTISAPLFLAAYAVYALSVIIFKQVGLMDPLCARHKNSSNLKPPCNLCPGNMQASKRLTLSEER